MIDRGSVACASVQAKRGLDSLQRHGIATVADGQVKLVNPDVALGALQAHWNGLLFERR